MSKHKILDRHWDWADKEGEANNKYYLKALDTFDNIVKDQYFHLVYPNICIK